MKAKNPSNHIKDYYSFGAHLIGLFLYHGKGKNTKTIEKLVEKSAAYPV